MKSLAIGYVILLMGCSTMGSTASNGKGDVITGRPELRLTVSKACPIYREKEKEASQIVPSSIAALLVDTASLIAGKVVAGAIDKLAAYLGNDRALTVTDAVPLDHYLVSSGSRVAVTPEAGCVTVAIARSSAFSSGEVDDGRLARWLASQSEKVSITLSPQAFTTATGLYSEPDFYAEFRVITGPEDADIPTVVRLDPKIVSFNRFSMKDAFLRPTERDVLLSITIASPQFEQPFATLLWKWDAITPDSIDARRLESRPQPWTAIPVGTLKSPGPGADFLPVNIVASYTETSHPHVLAKALADALKDERASAVKATTDYVSGLGTAGK